MKRFIIYIYEYEREIKGRNTGFIKADIRDNCSRIDIHIRGLDRFKGKGNVYFIVSSADNTIGIPASDIMLNQGCGYLKLLLPENRLGNTGFQISKLNAVIIRYDNGKILAGSFDPEPVMDAVLGSFTVWGEKSDSCLTSEIQQEIPLPETNTEREMEVCEQSAPHISYQRIELTDIRRLPASNWHLCNNHFLIHGFFNYHYLILKTVESTDGTKKYLGVPGIYEQPERMMALLFGFSSYETPQSDTDNMGYWMCELDDR